MKYVLVLAIVFFATPAFAGTPQLEALAVAPPVQMQVVQQCVVSRQLLVAPQYVVAQPRYVVAQQVVQPTIALRTEPVVVEARVGLFARLKAKRQIAKSLRQATVNVAVPAQVVQASLGVER